MEEAELEMADWGERGVAPPVPAAAAVAAAFARLGRRVRPVSDLPGSLLTDQYPPLPGSVMGRRDFSN
jgi:hypothetical protein